MAFVGPDYRGACWSINATESSIVTGPHREQYFSIDLMQFVLPESILVHNVTGM